MRAHSASLHTQPGTAAAVLADYPDADGTDAAHPAWWRGQEHTAAVFCQKVNKILDGKDDGRGVSNEPWESTRRRLLALAQPATSEGRRKAWETRRAKYGPQGHHGYRPRQSNAGALHLLIQLHADGILSEGQVSQAAGLDRIEIRRRREAVEEMRALAALSVQQATTASASGDFRPCGNENQPAARQQSPENKEP